MRSRVLVLLLAVGCGDSVVPPTLVATVVEPAGPNCLTGGYAIESGQDLNGNDQLDPAEVEHTSYLCNPPAAPRELVAVVPEPAGANCANGGEAIETGADTNGNGVLDSSEITTTSYVCSGAPGEQALVAVVPEPAGANCANGGEAIETGADENGNGVLDASEIASTSYVCSGAAGENAMIRVDPEPPGSNCSSGGVAIGVGVDTNGDGVLETGEVESTTFLCNTALVPTVIDGDVVVHNSFEIAQLDGVETITGNLEIDSTTFAQPLVFSTLQTVGGQVTWNGTSFTAGISFPHLTTAGSIMLCCDLSSVDMPALVSVQSGIFLGGWFTDLTFPVLTTGVVAVQGGAAPNLVSVSLPALTIGGLGVGGPQLASVSLPMLRAVPYGTDFALNLHGGTLSSLDLPQLETGYVAVGSLPNLTSISLPKQTSGGLSVDTMTALGSIDLPVLASGEVAVGGAAVTSIHVPAFTTGDVAVRNAPALSELDLPLLATASGFWIDNNATLSTISAPNLTGAQQVTITNNPLLPTCLAQALATQANATTVTISGDDDVGVCQ